MDKYLIELVISGEPPRKSNQRRLFWAGKRPMFVKSQKAMDYVNSFVEQIPAEACLALGSPSSPLRLDAVVYYASNRPDLSIELVKDCLQKAGVIKDDRYIREEHVYGFVDKKKPRVELRIYALLPERIPPYYLE